MDTRRMLLKRLPVHKLKAKLAYLEKISKTLASVDLEIALRRAIRCRSGLPSSFSS